MAAAAGEAARPFDLVQGPLIRAVLLRLSPEDHLVALTLHHIVSDGWSMAIIIRELAALYNAFVSGSESPLPPLLLQYADYAIYQRNWLDSGVMAKQLAYWTEHFAEMPPSLEIPLDRDRPSMQSFQADRVGLFIDSRLTEPLRALAQREGATLFMVLLAAFKVLLHRYSGETDICVGTPIANRKWAETEGLIGFFLNTLVLRTNLSGDPTFRELISRVRQTTLDGYANQDVPFERLLQVVQPQRDLSRTPLFQTFFNMLNFPLTTITLSELSVQPDFDPVGSKFDMTPYIREMDDGIQFDMVFNSDLFDRARMIELLEQIRLVLRQAAADGEVKLSAIDLASVAHRERVAARRVATVDEAVSELRASSGDLAGVGELCEIVVDGVPSGRLGRYSPEGAVIPLVTGIRPSRRLGVCVDACRVRSSTGSMPWQKRGADLPSSDGRQLSRRCLRRSRTRRSSAFAARTIAGRNRIRRSRWNSYRWESRTTRLSGNSSMPSAPSWKALRTYLVPMKALIRNSRSNQGAAGSPSLNGSTRP